MLENHKESYANFCNENNLPIFHQDWWLDAVAGSDNWDVKVVKKQNNILAALPFGIKKFGRYYFINMPKFTPYLGPWISYQHNQNYSKKLIYEKHKLLLKDK